MNLANEGLEARKKDEEVAQRKRKAEDDKNWEGTYVSFNPIYLYSISCQIIGSNVLIAGVPSPALVKRRRKLKP
jgi:hypothetical protein